VLPDDELIRKSLAGDRRAFDELVVRYRKQVYLTAYRMVENAEIAEEIAQETFLRAYRQLRSFRRKARFTTWLYRITMNLCYTELKRSAKENTPVPPAVNNSSDRVPGKLMEEERMAWLKRQIALLPFKQRAAVTLRTFQNMSFNEIGHSLGCTAGSARVNYRHAILKLKEALKRSGEEL
jgi:RNA polymerase sigma-70 factor (ECF subfamily)